MPDLLTLLNPEAGAEPAYVIVEADSPAHLLWEGKGFTSKPGSESSAPEKRRPGRPPKDRSAEAGG